MRGLQGSFTYLRWPLSLVMILFPWFEAASMTYMVPMFFYEVPLGLWFLVKGVRAPTTTER